MRHLLFYTAVAIAIVVGIGLLQPEEPILDEALAAGLSADAFPQLDVDAFPGLDPHAALSSAAVRGRNTWLLWTGGSQRFLDWLATEGYGISDTLMMLDSRRRDDRFDRLGLMNEPGFKSAAEPDAHGLWLDVPANGGRMGRTDAIIVGEGIGEHVYGRSTGVIGFRLFPNPEFDEEAAEAWDADRFYTDDRYRRNKNLVRPYRVGMTCAVCHVAPNPLDPPADPNRPEWHNLVSLIGNQYIREGRVFASNLEGPAAGEPSSFLWEMLEAQLPGTSDTSRMATDHINNPNAINGIFSVAARLSRATPETVAPIWHEGDVPAAIPVPHVLKDGADSVGLAGAALRVYVNIGVFSEYWLTLHRPIAGVKYQRPFEVPYAREHSTYWNATEERMADLAQFFLSSKPLLLKDARWVDADGDEHTGEELLANEETLTRGRLAFARNCAGCHSSERVPAGLAGDERVEWLEVRVLEDDYLRENFLSDDRRHPIDKIGTNACRALATNAKAGRIWDNFSSETYKHELPAVEQIEVFDPRLSPGTDNPGFTWSLAERGIEHSLGYYRTPSLISLWTSAPFLHNNALGKYTGDPSVAGRLDAFEDAAEKLLWPEKRDGQASIRRTRSASVLQVPVDYLPGRAAAALRQAGLVAADEDGRDYARLGPIPARTSINLLANLDLSLGALSDFDKVVRLYRLAKAARGALRELEENRPEGEELLELLRERLVPLLLDNSKCPDLVEDRGHTFGSDLPDDDKRALIEFLKTV